MNMINMYKVGDLVIVNNGGKTLAAKRLAGRSGKITSCHSNEDSCWYRLGIENLDLNDAGLFEGEIRLLNMNNEKELQMNNVENAKSRGLFEIHAVKLATDEVVFEQKVVAEGETDALYESDLKSKLKDLGLSKDEVHIVITEIGPVPLKPKAQVVKLLDKVCAFVKGDAK